MPRLVKSPQIGQVNEIRFDEIETVIRLAKAWSKKLGEF